MSEVTQNKGVFRSEEIREVEVEHEGSVYKLKLKACSWSEMNKILSKCSSYTADRKGVFDLDLYYREALIAMVIESPWGPFNHTLLVKFSPEFGAKLEALVPLPGGAAITPFVQEQS